MAKLLLPITFVVLCLTVLFLCTKFINDDVYAVGENNVHLQLISGTKSYIDQYERLWSLVSVESEGNEFKAIPAGDNSCLLENVALHPYLNKDVELANYIKVDGRCIMKEAPFNEYTFNKSDNSDIFFTKKNCSPDFVEINNNCVSTLDKET